MRASRLSTSSTGDSSFFSMRRAASAMVRKSGTIVLLLRKGGGMRGLGADPARLAHQPRHLLVAMRRGGDVIALRLGHVEPDPRQRRIEFLSSHVLAPVIMSVGGAKQPPVRSNRTAKSAWSRRSPQ